MKKTFFIIALAFFTCTAASAQFNFSDKPFVVPKKAVNLSNVSEQTTVKAKQMVFYQWTRKADDMTVYAIAITEGMDLLEKIETHIYTNSKTQEKTNTWQWKAVKKGTAKMEIESSSGESKVITLKIE